MFNRTFLIILFILVEIYPLFSQNNKDVMDILTSKTWYCDENDNGMKDDYPQVRFSFTQDSLKFFIYGDKAYENFDTLSPFYLSDEKDDEFDQDKVGKIKNGRYVIQNLLGEIRIMEIVSIEDEKIIFRFDLEDGFRIKVFRSVN